MPNRVNECTIPAMGDFPPLFTFAEVRAMAPVAGSPPKNGQTMLATPCATSSVLLSWRSPVKPSATTAESSDSMAPSTAIAVAGPMRSRIIAQSKCGHEIIGRPAGIAPAPNFEPTVEIPKPSCQPNAATNAVEPSIATMDPGIRFRPSRGHNNIKARQPTARMTVGILISLKCFISQCRRSMNSRGAASPV